jgi:hypothetical protein
MPIRRVFFLARLAGLVAGVALLAHALPCEASKPAKAVALPTVTAASTAPSEPEPATAPPTSTDLRRTSAESDSELVALGITWETTGLLDGAPELGAAFDTLRTVARMCPRSHSSIDWTDGESAGPPPVEDGWLLAQVSVRF